MDKIHNLHLFDDGYEKLRERIFENQKKLGVIPQDAKLTPWPNDVLKPWDQLTADEKKLFIRQVEVFAAYSAYNDYEVGRVVKQFQDLGKLDNTLIIYINGDNGTSAEGGPLGTPNEVAFFNGLNKLPAAEQLKFYDVWGTEQTYNHMSAGWSWAFDTPFDWFKQNASRLGGINQNMVVSWPARIKDKGALREQFVHVIDVVPTILEAAGIRPPEVVDGIRQSPIEGTSFLYTLDSKNAKAPSRHTTQYFEMMGQWALYKDDWVLSTKVNRAPWDAFGPANPDPLNNQVFQLYNLNEDFTQSQDIAAQNPQKVKEMRQEFVAEARKYQVFPFDASNDFSGVGRPGVGTLKVDGQVVATKTMPKTLPMILQWDESFDIGSDTLTGVNDADYQPPFAFTGKLNKLTVKLDRPQLSPEDIKKLEAAQRNNPVSE